MRTQTEKSAELKLHENIQFVYELVLARKELEALGVAYELQDDLRTFTAERLPDPERLLKRSAYFASVDGRLSDYHFLQQYNRTRSVNQYLTHWIYPYKGKFHPQMIRAFLNLIQAEPGDVILDPFLGSGTVAVEAQLLGMQAVGLDISPLCVLISQVKTQSHEVLEQIQAVIEQAGSAGRRPRSERLESEEPRVRNFFLAAEMVAESDRSRRRKDLETAVAKATERMLQSVQDQRAAAERFDLPLPPTTIQQGDARKLALADASIDGIICSPPYSIALNYVRNDAHALEAMGCRLDEIQEEFIGVRGRGKEKLELYDHDLDLCLGEMARVLRPGKWCVIVIGDVTLDGERLPTTDRLIEAAESHGLHLQDRIDKIIFGLYNIMQREFILLLRKE